jgi:hypothetical protein
LQAASVLGDPHGTPKPLLSLFRPTAWMSASENETYPQIASYNSENEIFLTLNVWGYPIFRQTCIVDDISHQISHEVAAFGWLNPPFLSCRQSFKNHQISYYIVGLVICNPILVTTISMHVH